MILPYKYRICTEIAGHVFELARFHRAIYHSDETFWLEGREERTWIERPLRDNETDTDRPVVKRPGAKLVLRLKREEFKL